MCGLSPAFQHFSSDAAQRASAVGLQHARLCCRPNKRQQPTAGMAADKQGALGSPFPSPKSGVGAGVQAQGRVVPVCQLSADEVALHSRLTGRLVLLGGQLGRGSDVDQGAHAWGLGWAMGGRDLAPSVHGRITATQPPTEKQTTKCCTNTPSPSPTRADMVGHAALHQSLTQPSLRKNMASLPGPHPR